MDVFDKNMQSAVNEKISFPPILLGIKERKRKKKKSKRKK
jgi:hypothetical protein